MTIEMTDAENDLKVALDRYNQLVLGITDEGDLVDAREMALEKIGNIGLKVLLRD